MKNYENILREMTNTGAYIFGEVLDASAADELYKKATTNQIFGPELFLSEDEYRANPQHKGVNPRKGRNYIEQFDAELMFVENDIHLQSVLKQLLGNDYTIFDKKFVCGVPNKWLPQWLKTSLKGSPINNLGAYIRPEYRNITYFHGIDFHQDNIDWPRENGSVNAEELITLYIYIHAVGAHDSPLYLMPKSHKLGATRFPHKLVRKGENLDLWNYTDDQGSTIECNHLTLTGEVGYCAIWHSATLHGTRGIINDENEGEEMRLSLRYLLRRSSSAKRTGLDVINDNIGRELDLAVTRVDLDDDGKVKVKKNIIEGQI